MFNLPAVCMNCGTVFQSGFGLSVGVIMTSTNNMSGPCPNCDGNGRVPDGIYEVIQDIDNTLKVDNAKDVYKLQRILNTTNNFDTINNVKDRVKKETPQYIKVIDAIEYFFSKTKNTLAAIGIVSTIVFGITSMDKDSSMDENIKNQNNIIKEQRDIINDYKALNKELKEKEDDHKEE
ncbi:hypothetical protein HB162lentus_04100 [Mammaliicoccus lentus]